jgi:hypothetical protein
MEKRERLSSAGVAPGMKTWQMSDRGIQAARHIRKYQLCNVPSKESAYIQDRALR